MNAITQAVLIALLTFIAAMLFAIGMDLNKVGKEFRRLNDRLEAGVSGSAKSPSGVSK